MTTFDTTPVGVIWPTSGVMFESIEIPDQFRRRNHNHHGAGIDHGQLKKDLCQQESRALITADCSNTVRDATSHSSPTICTNEEITYVTGFQSSATESLGFDTTSNSSLEDNQTIVLDTCRQRPTSMSDCER
eukprot:CFRG4850T1